MAITRICSSPSHSPTLPTMSLSSLPTFPTLKTHHSLQPTLPSISSKYGTNLVSSDALVIAAATEAVALANAAVEAARDAVAVSGKEWPFGESENGMVRDKSKGLDLRRKRRRKRRKSLGCMEEENHSNCSPQRLLVGSGKSGFLSSSEEAELCLCLKVHIYNP